MMHLQNLFSVFTFIFLLSETSYILELLYNSTYYLNLAFQYFEGPGWPKWCNLKLEKCSQIYSMILGTARNELNTTLKLPNTWTHIFVCLGKTIDLETPNQAYKKQLQDAGRGEKKIVFKKKTVLIPTFTKPF